MGAPIRSHKIVAIRIFWCAVQNKLWPAMWRHRSESYFKRQVPHNFVTRAFRKAVFKTVLPSASFISTCKTPVVPCYKIELNRQTIKLKELSELNLPHYCKVKVTEGLNLRIKTLSVFVELVHVFVFEQIIFGKDRTNISDHYLLASPDCLLCAAFSCSCFSFLIRASSTYFW